MKKLYFKSADSEMCHSLDVHIDEAKMNGMEEIELFEAVPIKDANYFWCKANLAVGEKGECGKICNDYKPRNGKSGACRYYSNTLYERGEKVTINV